MNLQQLEAFYWIVRLGSFGAAAEKLGTTQPAVSARIKALEQALGTSLFARDGKIPQLSPSARLLVPMVEDVLGGIARIESEVAAEGSIAGVVRIGMGEIVALSWFPEFVARLNAAYPSVQIQVFMDVTVQLNKMLDNGELDLALVVTPGSPSLRAQSVGSTPLQWMAASSLVPPGAEPSPDELARLPVYTFVKNSHLYMRTVNWFRDRRARPKIIHSCNNLGVIINLVKLGCGIALIPAILVQEELRSGKLRIVAPDYETRIEFFVVRHEDVIDPTILRIAEMAIQTTVFDMHHRS